MVRSAAVAKAQSSALKRRKPKPKPDDSDPAVTYSGRGVTSFGSALPGGTASGSKGSSGGGGGGGGGGMSGAERRAVARENKAKADAAKRYRKQAATLDLQAKSLKKALGSGFKKALDQRLSNISLVTRQQDKVLVDGYKARLGSLRDADEDNEKAASDSTNLNLTNRVRERASAIDEAMTQGAGESDVLRSQIMSLRSWDANQNEVNRSYYDTLSSTNSALTDLNTDTRNARINVANQANADRDQVWTQYYNQRSEAWTQLGNIRGQQAELYGYAEEQGSKKSAKDEKEYTRRSGSAFDKAAKVAGMTYDNPGVRSSLLNWQPKTQEFEGELNTGEHVNTSTTIGPKKKPEGATLRKW